MAELSGGCVYLAHHTLEVLAEAGIPCCIQAGTMCWPRVTEEQDDGVSSTHFSYVWEPEHPRSQEQMRAGRLPELHAWVGIPATQEVVDLTTRNFPKACMAVLGEPWLGPKPPDYLWQRELPDWVVYEPNEQATLYTMVRLWKLYQPSYARHLAPRLEEIAKRMGIHG